VGELTIKKESGFTVVELLIVLALLGLVLSVVYMYFSFGYDTFVRGERQSIAQQSIRQGADFITGELRYADEIILDPTNLNEEGYYYIIQDGTSVIYYQVDSGGSQVQNRTILDSVVDDIDYEISIVEDTLLTQVSYKLILEFTLTADDELYSLDTKVNILNLNDADKYQDGDGDSASAVMFKKPYLN